MGRIFRIYRQSFSGLSRRAWILATVMFINRSGSMVLLFSSLYMTTDLHFSLKTAGFVMSFYGVGSILGSYAGGWLSDRRHYFEIMVYSLIVSAALLLLMLIVRTPAALASVLFSVSFFADTFRPANSKALATNSNSDNRTRSVSLVRLAANLGFTVGPAAGGFIAFYAGYRWLYIIDAVTSLAAAVVLIIFFKKNMTDQPKSVNAVLNDSSTSAYRDFPFLLFIILVASYATCFFQIFASIPQFFSRVCHYNEHIIGVLLGLNGLLVVLIEMPVVMILERKRKNILYIIMGTLCLPVCFAMLIFGHPLLIWALIYTFTITISEILAMPFMMNITLSRPPVERQGQYSALYSIGYGIAIILAPSIGLGIAERYGFNTMFLFFIILSIVTAIGFYAVQKQMNINKTT